VIGGVLLALFAAAVPLSRLAHQSLNAGGGSVPVWVSAAFAAAGWVLAFRRPANPLGWIMLGDAFFFALSEDASYYTVADYGLRHGDLPLGGLALLAQPGWAPGIVLLGLLVLLFPDGRLPSSRWRWLVAAYAAVAALWMAGVVVCSQSAPWPITAPRWTPAGTCCCSAATTPPPAGGTWCRACSSRCSSPAGWPRSPARRSASSARQGNAVSS
jgi:hypothetical protein